MTAHAHMPVLEPCLICGQLKSGGIHIANQLICDSCQEKIVETDVTDWKYQHFVNKLSKLKMGGETALRKTK